ncbi:MAG: M48 family metallopeptidase [Actinobacteria bacterium]|nr:M48 family metallopeptidase [Actinomycetota bacterium]
MLLTALVIIVLAAYIIESMLDNLNLSTARNTLDPKIAHLYDARERERSISYSAEKTRFGFISSTTSTLILIFALSYGWFASLDGWARGIFDSQILVSLLFVASLSVIFWLLNLPFTLYGTFRIEEKYGFNKTTPKVFVTDTIKGAALAITIGGSLLTAVLWLYQELEASFWILGWALFALFSLLMFMFGTTLILPLFNKLEPVKEGPLREGIEKYCASQGYNLGRLFVMDGSKRSSKANAFFSGLGSSKTIVLFDTLLEKLSTTEIIAVLAHEIGHYKKRHTLSMFIFSNIQTFATFALLGWLLGYPELSTALGAKESSFHLSALTFFILFTPLSIFFGLISNTWSRHNEYEADTFAKQTYKEEPMRSALSKISTDSLANLSPHPAFVAFNYTHPTLLQRLNNLG